MSPPVLLVVYCFLILLASLAGGWLPLMIRLTHQRMQLAVSLVAGVMLGVGLLHMLPHALMEVPQSQSGTVFLWVLAGFLAMFFLERFFCFHHHDVPDEEGAGATHQHADHSHGSEAIDGESHRLTWTGAAIGLTLHTIFAGVALAASVEAESHGDRLVALAGLGTFLVIFLHKPFDAMTITTLMTVGEWSMATKHFVNGLFALMIPVGVLLFHVGLSHSHDGGSLIAYALAFSAGTFLCISMSDLLPELQFHAHDRAALSLALILGLSVAWVIGIFEAQGHGHQHHEHPAAAEAHEHGHSHAGEHAHEGEDPHVREHGGEHSHEGEHSHAH